MDRLPEQTAARIVSLRREGRRVVTVGDGVNEAPGIVESDLGIGPKLERMSSSIPCSDLRDVATVLGLFRATYRRSCHSDGSVDTFAT
jgi:P-type E1-E2 ATPase